MAPKKRKYHAEYIKYGFVNTVKNGVEVPQCVVCLYTLSNDALRLTRLQRHLHHRHPELSKKPVECFCAKRNFLFKMRLDKKGKAVKVSYEIAMLIAKNKKPHTIGENLVKSCIVNVAKILLWDDMANCDESTDQANCAQLIVYARFIANDTIEEELLFSEPLKTTWKRVDVFQAVSQVFEVNGLMWEKLVGVCTDGAPAMLGSRSGFVKMVKSKNPSIFAMHCVIHRQALVAKTLPDDLREDLNFAVEVVNYVQSSALNIRLFAALCESLNADHMALLHHTEVCWLSKGNMLGRIYELREAVAEFLEQRGRRTIDKCISEDLKRKIKGHLRSLQDENPFLVKIEDLPHDLQEEAIELKFNSLAKDSFESMQLENFWVRLQTEYPKRSSRSLRILVPFSSTYLCKTGFSALMTLNTQHRNRLNVESDLRCTLSPTPPRIDNLVANKHCQYSH
ncbi:SCAN domain-containing protein 3 [Trichinella pseudospiralis]|uniref:SCAN domain-containing protein 3 n=1 Tax=Trichinella pseudospiralis TaxID=6337 RepID=A0A0V1K2G7_TRIPS|nr:SCAN domain-containing protein 3 [Trichinella pseudospiralis]